MTMPFMMAGSTPMKPEVKELWLAALRSGEFQQDTGVLRTEKGYCCLGVLCELAVREGVIPEAVLEARDYRYGVPGYVGDDVGTQTGVLPTPVRVWAGLTASNPVVTGTWERPGYRTDMRITETLSGWNDAGHDFGKIADLIEENL